MRRLIVSGFLYALFAAVAPTPAWASPVQCYASGPSCVIIGEFAWQSDTFGDVFALKNLSSGVLADDFTSVSVATNGGLSSGFFDDPLAPQHQTEALVLFDGPTSATLTFLFRGTQFHETLLASDLTLDDVTGFASRLLLAEIPSTAPQPVPEPATLTLLGVGLAALRAARRRTA